MKPVNSAVIELRDLQLRTDILSIDIRLRKAPVRRGNGVLGVRLSLNEAATQDLRHSLQNPK